jgi:hypothetical protein
MSLETYSIRLEESENESFVADSDKDRFSFIKQILYWGVMFTLLMLRLHVPWPWQ